MYISVWKPLLNEPINVNATKRMPGMKNGNTKWKRIILNVECMLRFNVKQRKIIITQTKRRKTKWRALRMVDGVNTQK